MTNLRRWLIAGITAIVISLAGLGAALTQTSVTVATNPPVAVPSVPSPSPVVSPEPTLGCDKVPSKETHFFADDTSNNTFGPSLIHGQLSADVADLRSRHCVDPLLLLTHMSLVDNFDPNDSSRQLLWSADYPNYVRRIHYDGIVQTMLPAGRYISFSMKRVGGRMIVYPEWVKYEKPSLVLLVPIEDLGGKIRVRAIREICGGQPVLISRNQLPPALQKYL